MMLPQSMLFMEEIVSSRFPSYFTETEGNDYESY